MARRHQAMSQSVAIDYASAAFEDIERLEVFLQLQGNPLSSHLVRFIGEAISILAIQPGMGRPVAGGYRELIIHCGRSGYLARYSYNRDKKIVTVLRIRHQSESGYTIDEI